MVPALIVAVPSSTYTPPPFDVALFGRPDLPTMLPPRVSEPSEQIPPPLVAELLYISSFAFDAAKVPLEPTYTPPPLAAELLYMDLTVVPPMVNVVPSKQMPPPLVVAVLSWMLPVVKVIEPVEETYTPPPFVAELLRILPAVIVKVPWIYTPPPSLAVFSLPLPVFPMSPPL